MEVSIELDDVSNDYYAGSTITGVLVLSNSSGNTEVLNQSSAMTITGEGVANWTILIHTDDPESPVDYRKLKSSRTFLYRKLHYGLSPYDGEGMEECMVHQGNNYYPIQLTLPHSLPSSFEGGHGKIVYYIDVTLHVVGQEIIRKRHKFYVTAIRNLNNTPAAADVGQCYLQIAGANEGMAGVLIKTSRIGFIAGENIPLFAKVINKSSYYLQLRFFICQRDTFRIQDQMKSTYKIIGEKIGPQITPGETKAWSDTSFQIPKNVKIIGDACDIIKSTYTLEIEVSATGRSAGFHTLKKVTRTGSIPLIIGTTRLASISPGSSSREFDMDSLLNEQALFMPSAPPLEVDPNEPPPSYEDAVASTVSRRRSEYHGRRPRHCLNISQQYGTL